MEFYSIQRILNRSKSKNKLIWSKIARTKTIKEIIANKKIKVDNTTKHSILRGSFFDFTTINAIIKYLVEKQLIFPITPQYLDTCSHTYLVDYSQLLQPEKSSKPIQKLKNFKNSI